MKTPHDHQLDVDFDFEEEEDEAGDGVDRAVSDAVQHLDQWLQAEENRKVVLANELGISSGAIAHWTSSRSVPQLRLACALEQITGTPVRAWFTYSGPLISFARIGRTNIAISAQRSGIQIEGVDADRFYTPKQAVRIAKVLVRAARVLSQ